MTNPINATPYLRTTRQFPHNDMISLVQELDKSYIDTSRTVNVRTIGLFPTNRPAINGEQWYLTNNQKQQGLREVYPITSVGNIPHNLNLNNINQFVRIWGTFTDGTYWYPLPYVDTSNVNNQISIKVDSTNIIITAGGGSPPTISSGTVVLEWLSEV